MDVADSQKLHDKVVDAGHTQLLTRKSLQILENAAKGHYETPARKKKGSLQPGDDLTVLAPPSMR